MRADRSHGRCAFFNRIPHAENVCSTTSQQGMETRISEGMRQLLLPGLSGVAKRGNNGRARRLLTFRAVVWAEDVNTCQIIKERTWSEEVRSG